MNNFDTHQPRGVTRKLLVAVIAILLLHRVASALGSEPQQQTGGGHEQKDGAWLRTFTDGVSVELVAISELSSEQPHKWWNPEGKILNEPPYDTLPGGFPETDDGRVWLQFAFRIQWKGKEPERIEVECGDTKGHLGPVETEGERPENILANAMLFHVARRHARLTLRRGHGKDADTVTLANVSLYPGLQIRAGQQEISPPRYYVQSIHGSMLDSQVWLDLKRRLESSELKYQSVTVDEYGHCRLVIEHGTPDLAPLRGAKIDTLSLAHTGKVSLEPLRGMPIKRLSLRGSQITDLSPLQGMPLKHLDISSTPITDLSPLRGMPLESLSLWLTKVSNLSPLSEAHLKSLTAASSKVEDLRPLAGQPLVYLDLRSTPVSDLAPLEGMTLDSLQLDHTQVANLSPVQSLSLKTLSLTWKAGLNLRHLRGQPLTWLKLEGSGFDDLSSLTGLKLEKLYLNETSVRDLAPVKEMPLRELSLRQTPVVDLAPLRGMKLNHLYLSEPGVDLEAVRNMPLELVAIPDPATVKNLHALRAIKTLKWIRPQISKPIRVDVFWRWYDYTARNQATNSSGDNSWLP